MFNSSRLTLLVLTLGLVGCASTSYSDRTDLLKKPVNCTTAEQDIYALEQAFPSSFDRIKSVAKLATPVGRVTGALKRENDDKVKTALGKTERDLKAKIEEIEQTCDLKVLPHPTAYNQPFHCSGPNHCPILAHTT